MVPLSKIPLPPVKERMPEPVVGPKANPESDKVVPATKLWFPEPVAMLTPEAKLKLPPVEVSVTLLPVAPVTKVVIVWLTVMLEAAWIATVPPSPPLDPPQVLIVEKFTAPVEEVIETLPPARLSAPGFERSMAPLTVIDD